MKIVFLLSRIPYRLEKGDKLRAFHQLKQLSEKHEIILVSLTDKAAEIPEAMEALKPYCSHLYFFPLSKVRLLTGLSRSLLNSKPIQVNYFYHQAVQEQIDAIIKKHRPDHIYCQLIRMAEYVRHIKHIPKTLDYMDALSKGVKRRFEIAPFYTRAVFKLEAERLEKYESEVFDDFEFKTIISRQDRELIRHPENHKIEIVPNGIDTGFFRPLSREKKYELVFAGNMNYPPNVETAVFLAKKVMPVVLKKIPQAKLMLAGATPNPRVTALASEHVLVSGWMEDIREAYAAAEIFVAPMTIGTGMQNKVLEAMAMKIPCIISKLVNNGIGGTDQLNLLVADTPEEVAEKVFYLLENKNRAQELAENAYDFVNENYNWANAVGRLEKLMNAGAANPAKINLG